MFGGGMDGAMGFDQGKALEASFKEFLSRPENAALVEKQQRKEARQALKLEERAHLETLREAVMGADFEAQRAIAPYLRTPCLRRIVQTFANDVRGDFSAWASNPRVIEMLAAAQRMLDEGRMTEEEMEHVLLAQLKDPAHEAHSEFEAKSRRVARLPTDALVGALNEHLNERRRGNEHYRARRWKEALRHYTRAAAVVEHVEGLSSVDQAEIILNRVAVYNNLAALFLAQQEYTKTLEYCNKVLELDPANTKAILRKTRALIGCHDYTAAEQSLAVVGRLPQIAHEADQLQLDLDRARRHGAASERATFSSMFAAPRAQATAT